MTQLEQILPQFISKKNSHILQTEIQSFHSKIHKLELDYHYLKQLSESIHQLIESKTTSLAHLKTKIFKYFKFLKELEYGVFDLKSKFYRSIQFYEELLNRQTLVQQKIDTLLNEMEQIQTYFHQLQSLVDTEELKVNGINLQQNINLFVDGFRNGKLDIEELDQDILRIRQAFDILNDKLKIMVQLA